MKEQEALREIWRRRQDTPPSEWTRVLEAWVVDLLTEPTYDEGYKDGTSEHEDDYDKGYDKGRKDALAEEQVALR